MGVAVFVDEFLLEELGDDSLLCSFRHFPIRHLALHITDAQFPCRTLCRESQQCRFLGHGFLFHTMAPSRPPRGEEKEVTLFIIKNIQRPPPNLPEGRRRKLLY